MAHLKLVASEDKSAHVELTVAHIKALKAQRASSELRIADSIEPGLSLRRDPRNGIVSFIYRGRVRGAEGSPIAKVKIGPATDARSLSKARARAIEIREQLAAGVHPGAARRIRAAETKAAAAAIAQSRERDEGRAKWTVLHSMHEFVAWRQQRPDKRLKPKSERFYREAIGYVASTIGNVSVEALTVDRVRDAIDAIPTVAKRSKARRALHTVVAFGLGKVNSDRANPVGRLDKGEYAPPKKRDTFLDELGVGHFLHLIFSAKPRSPVEDAARDYLLLNLLNAPRKDELRLLRWQDVDMVRNTYRVPDTKTGEGYVMPITQASREVFAKRQAASNGSPYVFAGRDKGKPIAQVRNFLARVLGGSSLTFTLHDSRRTMASALPALGIVGPRAKHLLHHKSNDITEGGYTMPVLQQMRADLEAYQRWALAAFDKHTRAGCRTDEPKDAEPQPAMLGYL